MTMAHLNRIRQLAGITRQPAVPEPKTKGEAGDIIDMLSAQMVMVNIERSKDELLSPEIQSKTC
jgi:hypothetical protein